MANVLFLWAFVQSLLMSFAIGFLKKSRSNSILSGVFFTMSINILFQYLFRYTDVKFILPELLFVSDVLDLLQPALILWYLDELFGDKIDKQKAWYFIPPAIALVSGIFYIASFETFLYDSFIGTPFHLMLLGSIVVWRGVIGFKIFKKFKSLQPKKNDSKKANDLHWPKVLGSFIGITFYIALLQLVYRTILFPLNGSAFVWDVIQLNYILFNSSIILITIYFALKFPKALSGNTLVVKMDKTDQTIMNSYMEKLNELIDVDQIHINTELNEKLLSERLGIPSYMLSRLLNDHIGKSFSEFFNEKRVDEAKKIIASDTDKKLTNFAIAVDCGFRSESVFYINFKKITGMTPRQFRIKLKEEGNGMSLMTG
ncbi:AraC family transcriptional regulator [Flammeovirga sp. MY04]|nr:AraC family transcriptional regulator [Flammeovirga sp. MY04]